MTLVYGPSASPLLGSCNSPDPSLLANVTVRGWVSEPNARGTWSLLYSCLFTIGLCVWTAIHLNIPARLEGTYQRKLKWALITLFAPEVVLVAALLQLNRARKLLVLLRAKSKNSGGLIRKLEEARDLHEAPERSVATGHGVTTRRTIIGTESPPEKLNLTYCFYVVMGGFIADTSTISNGRMPPVVTLTDHAVVALANRGRFLNVPSEAIADKSKEDLLAKGLVVCQVCWLVIQAIARARANLPLTLLEIHAMVHVFTAFIMYLCWMRKPKDIQIATPIEPGAFKQEMQDMLAHYEPNLDSLELKPGSEIHYFSLRMNQLYSDPTVEGPVDALLWVAPAIFCIAYSAVHMGASGQWHADHDYFPTYVEAIFWDVANYLLIGISGTYLVFVVSTVFVALCAPPLGRRLMRSISAFLLTPLIIKESLRMAEDFSFQSRRFPSVSWKRSQLLVATALGLLVCFLCGASRLFIVLESFISLRVVPLNIYVLPDWINYLPHF